MERKVLTKPQTPSRREHARSRAAAAPAARHPLAALQQSIGNRAVQRLISSHYIQAKLNVSTPGDPFEREADQVARLVMSAPQTGGSVAQRRVGKEEGEDKLIRTKPAEAVAESGGAGGAVESHIAQSKGGGNPLPGPVRTFMEPRFGVDFSNVRVHTGGDAAQMNRAVSAQAFTHGSDIYYGAGQSPGDLDLTAHELTHVVQQTGGERPRAEGSNGPEASDPQPSVQRRAAPHIQRRLIVSGSSEALVNEYLGIVGGAAGLRLNWSFAQPRVTNAGNLPGPVPSPEGRANILRVINAPRQNAELHIGTNQPRVSVGAFPGAASTIQTIDVDDIRNLNASLPGQGTAKAFHEMMENFNAHGVGFGNFGASHAVGLEAESNVLENQGIVGRRLGGGLPATVIPAPPGQPVGPNITYQRQLQVFTHYFLEIIQRVTTGSPTGPGADFEVVSAQRIPKVQVSQRTIDSFVSGSVAIPPAGNATLAATLADLNANPNSTVLIEGFADSRGAAAGNVTRSRDRAATAQAFFIANGIAADRIAIVGRGGTNFVATNATEDGRRQNRRIQLTVHRP